jgi:hypothetical protein
MFFHYRTHFKIISLIFTRLFKFLPALLKIFLNLLKQFNLVNLLTQIQNLSHPVTLHHLNTRNPFYFYFFFVLLFILKYSATEFRGPSEPTFSDSLKIVSVSLITGFGNCLYLITLLCLKPTMCYYNTSRTSPLLLYQNIIKDSTSYHLNL